MKNKTLQCLGALTFLVSLTILFPLKLSAQIFSNPSLPVFPALGAGVHAWADYDGDGDQDLFLSGLDSSKTLRSWIMKNSGGAFTVDSSQQIQPIAYGNAAWADFDNDGDPDLAITGTIGPRTGFSQLYENQGGSLQLFSQPIPTLLNGDLEWADLDADGDLDLVMSGFSPSEGNTGYILENQGGTGFQVQLRPDLYVLTTGDLAIGDLNGDGLPDLVMTGREENGDAGIRILRNLGNFQFSSFNHLLTGAHHSDLSLADIDGDGKAEMVLQGINGQPEASIYELNAVGQIAAVSSPLAGLYRGDLTWFDFDNDGDQDLVTVGRANAPVSPLVYRQAGGVFTLLAVSPLAVGLETATLSVADLDSDTYLEILVSGQDAQHRSQTYVLKFNIITQTFEP